MPSDESVEWPKHLLNHWSYLGGGTLDLGLERDYDRTDYSWEWWLTQLPELELEEWSGLDSILSGMKVKIESCEENDGLDTTSG